MKEDKIIKITIIILITILGVILIIAAALLNKNEKKDNTIVQNVAENNNKNTVNENSSNETNNSNEVVNIVEDEDIPEILYGKISEVDNPTYFYTVRDCVESYFEDLDFIDDEEEGSSYIQSVYNQLSNSYIEKYNINIKNLTKYIKKNSGQEFVKINKMLQYSVKDNNIIRFFVSEIFKDDKNNLSYKNYIVYMDYINLTYAIEPTNKNADEIKEADLSKDIKEIKINDDNKYTYKVKTSIDYTK